MLTTLFTFLGGTAFRLIFGQVMDWLNKKQDHQMEMDLQKLQSQLDAERHTRDLERLRLQSELGVKEVQIVANAAEQKAMADAFLKAVEGTAKDTGIPWINGWNGSIRPAGATISLLLWIGNIIKAGFVLVDFDKTLIAAFLGVFVGDRIDSNRKK